MSETTKVRKVYTVVTAKRMRTIKKMMAEGHSKAAIARAVGISRRHLYRVLKMWETEDG